MTEIAAEAGISRQAIYQKHLTALKVLSNTFTKANQHILTSFSKYNFLK